VVDDPPTVQRLASAAFSGIYSMNRFAASAPVLVVVVTERSRYAARLGGQMRGVQYSLVDIGIACEHFVLQAAEDGVGTCWLGWLNEKAVRKVLRLPRGARIDIMLSMGYPEKEDIREKKRKMPAEVSEYFGGQEGQAR